MVGLLILFCLDYGYWFTTLLIYFLGNILLHWILVLNSNVDEMNIIFKSKIITVKDLFEFSKLYNIHNYLHICLCHEIKEVF